MSPKKYRPARLERFQSAWQHYFLIAAIGMVGACQLAENRISGSIVDNSLDWKISIETNSDGSGQELTTSTLTTDDSFEAFLIKRNQDNTFISAVSGDWLVKDESDTEVQSSISQSLSFSSLTPGIFAVQVRYDGKDKNLVLNVQPGATVGGTNEWTWMGGQKVRNQYGIYGTQGTPSTSNWPGSRKYVAHWTDSAGNFWLFGGSGYGAATGASALNDLWRYNPTTKEWTYISGSNETGGIGNFGAKGVANANNSPSARSWASFTKDAQGNLWLYGGSGIDAYGNSGFLSDVWKFNPSTLEWTWVAGADTHSVARNSGVETSGLEDASFTPGSREWACIWVDSTNNHLYLFGGSFPGLYQWQGDFWRLNTSTGEWAWLRKATGPNGAGIYGTQGAADAANIPGRRYAGAYWTDSNGDFWQFGGEGQNESGSDSYMNDLWRYQVSTGQWTWLSGNKAGNANATLTAGKDTYDPSILPGWVTVPSFTADSAGKLYLIGGWGKASSGGEQSLNQLYVFDTSIHQWAWISGTDGGNTQPVWGTLNMPDAANFSGWREGGGAFADNNGAFWYLGGNSKDDSGAVGRMNDLIRFY